MKANKQTNCKALEGRDKASDDKTSAGWAGFGLAVGLGLVLVTGVAGLMIYLIMRSQAVNGIQGSPQVIYVDAPKKRKKRKLLEATLAAPQMQLEAESPREYGASLMKSYRLPALADINTSPARVASAARDRAYRVLLRVVSPPGSFATFSNDANELITGSAAMPVGNTFTIPSGSDAYARLQPGQAIFAKGGAANVVVSVLLTEVHAD